MEYNTELESRIKNIVGAWKRVVGKKMFGCTAHLLDGNMHVGWWKDFLIVRLSGRRRNM